MSTPPSPQPLSAHHALQLAVSHHRAGNLPAAEQLYRAILQADPRHAEANHNLGALALAVGKPAAALPHLKIALETNPNQAQHWLSYIEALIQTDNLSAAGQLLAQGRQRGLAGEAMEALSRRLHGSEPGAPEAQFAAALALREAGHYGAAVQWLQDWIQQATPERQSAEARATAYAQLAYVLSLAKHDANAAEAIAAARMLAPSLPVVLRNHARLLLKNQQLDAAFAAAAEAYRQQASDPENGLVLAAALAAKKDDRQALLLIEQALTLRPEYAEAFANRGLLKLRQGDSAAAKAEFERALALKPHLHPIRDLLILACYQSNDLTKATAALEHGLAMAADNVEWLVQLGELKRRSYLYAEAIALLQRALALAPEHPGAWTNLGTTLHGQGELEKARVAYERALALNPGQPEVASNLGAMAKDAESWEAALSWFDRATQLQPDNVAFLGNKGIAMLKLRRPPQEIAAIAHAMLKMAPKKANGDRLLAELAKDLGQLDQARAHLETAAQKEPGSSVIQCALAAVLRDVGEIHAAACCCQRAITLDPDNHAAYSGLIFSKNYLGLRNDSAMPDLLSRYNQLVTARVANKYRQWDCQRSTSRLKIGLLSGDLRNHPVGFFLESLLAEIDANQFELVAYPTLNKTDELTARVKPYFSAWTPLYGLSDEAAAARIHADQIQILIDLSGHTDCHRLPVFAYKPAPVQVSWLGYFASTGIQAMDYWLADPFTCPESEQDFFTEQIWRLPESYLCFSPPAARPAITAFPAKDNGYVTFGCFNNLTKMNDEVVAVWARVLRHVPHSRLMLKTNQLADPNQIKATRARFAAWGIAEDRLILEGPSPRAELLAAYNRVDIALDPFPYPGGTTSAEALYMGVPVLTLRGDQFLSRVGETIAHNAGLPDWIADDHDDYVRKAAALAADLDALATLKAGLRAQVLASPLFDARRFARHFEQAMQGMWQAAPISQGQK